MYHYLLLVISLFLLCMSSMAQRKCIVIDMETHVPVRDVLVRFYHWTCTNDSQDTLRNSHGRLLVTSAKTAWDGIVEIDSLAEKIELSRSGYMGRKMDIAELADTIELLPSFNALSEVVVWGKRRTANMTFSLTPSSDSLSLPDPSNSASVSVDLLGGIEKLFAAKKRSNAKRVKEILDKY